MDHKAREQEKLDVLHILKRAGAMRQGHFVLASGRHADRYVAKDDVYLKTSDVSRLCRLFAKHFAERQIEAVVGPEMGGSPLSQWTAHHLTTSFSSLTGNEGPIAIVAEKERIAIPDPDGKGRKCVVETGNFVLKRGRDKLVHGKRVLVVEDVVTTGGSVKKNVELVRAAGGEVVGVAVLVNRGGVTAEDIGGVPELFSLVEVELDSWEEAECIRMGPCSRRVPINTDVGKGAEYLARQNAG